MNFEYEDLDWALGELLHLTWEAKCAGVLPHLYKPQLFDACLRLIYSYPFEIRKAAWDIWQGMRPTELYEPRRRRANARAR